MLPTSKPPATPEALPPLPLPKAALADLAAAGGERSDEEPTKPGGAEPDGRPMTASARPSESKADEAAADVANAGKSEARPDARVEVKLDRRMEAKLEAKAPGEFPLEVKLVGRQATLDSLRGLLDGAVKARELRFAALTGPPGIGKSRLVRELDPVLRAALPTARVLSAACEGDGAPPFAVFGRLFALRFGVVDGEGAREVRKKVAAVVGELVPAPRSDEVAELLGRMIPAQAEPRRTESLPGSSAPKPAPLSPMLSDAVAGKPGHLEARTFIAVRRFLAADAAKSPLMLIFDDIERASPETIKLIQYLAAGLEGHPVVLLVVGRPDQLIEAEGDSDGKPDGAEKQVFLKGGTPLTRIEVGPLSQKESGELFSVLVRPAGEPPPELALHARDRLGGSPRAISELVRFLLESDGIQRVGRGFTFDRIRFARRDRPERGDRNERTSPGTLPGAASSGTNPHIGALPATVEELAEARFRTLDAAHRDLLEKGAACGETFWLDAVVALCQAAATKDPEGPTVEEVAIAGERTRAEVAAHLEALIQRGLVVESPHAPNPGDREFRFAHPPWWVVVYGGLPEPTRRRYHRQIAQWLELLPAGRDEEEQEEVARHLELAGDGAAAAMRYRRAADGARTRYYNDKAIRLYQHALTCAPDGDIPTRIHIFHDLGSVHQLKGDHQAALEAFERMLRLSFVVASRTKAAVAWNKMGRIDRQRGTLKRALQRFERGMTLFRDTGDERGVAGSLDDIAQVLWVLGRYDEALDRGAAALEMRRRIGDKRSVSLSLLTIGHIERHRGLFKEAESCYHEALSLRKALEDRQGIAACLNGLGALSFQRGDYDGARRRWEEALDIAGEIGALPMVAVLEGHLGEVARAVGSIEEARSRFLRSEAAARDLEDKRLLSEALRNLGMLELGSGDARRALDLCQRAFALADEAGIRVDAGRALTALGEVHSQTLFHDQGDPGDKDGDTTAEDYFERAVGLFREIGNQAELGVALERYSAYRIERGDVDGGKTLLAQAHQIFTRLGMKAFGDSAQRMMTELD